MVFWCETMSDFMRYLSGQRLTNPKSRVTDEKTTLIPRESDMSPSSQKVLPSDQAGASLERDESRFRYFSPNGKAVIRDDYCSYLVVKTSYELAYVANAS
jgi:hypothetical protein